jgi:hypothetical protein
MTHNEKVASYKAYFQTGDPQFIPSVYEKTAHVNEVQAWKDRWTSSAGYEKEARAGHPANVALARAMSPGILPGLNPGGSKVHVSHNGDFNHDIAGFIEGGVDPGTLSYLRGDTGEKTAAPAVKRTSLSDILRKAVSAQVDKSVSKSLRSRPLVPLKPSTTTPSSPEIAKAQ